MKRVELVKLASKNGIEKASTTKSEVLENKLNEMGVKTKPGKKTGRPVNLNSARQKRLKELEAKKKAGMLKRGRPVNPTSERQKRLKELEEKKANGELKQGRPVDPNSARQKRLKEMEEKRKAGTLKRGRPVGSGKKSK